MIPSQVVGGRWWSGVVLASALAGCSGTPNEGAQPASPVSPAGSTATSATAAPAGPSPAAASAPTAVAASDAGSSPPAVAPKDLSVTLTSSGEAPRRVLRYVFHAGTKEHFVMDMRMAMTVTMDDHPAPPNSVPPTRMLATIDEQRVTPDGNLVYRFSLDSVDLTDKTGDPAVRQKVGESMRKLVGMTGDCEMTPRGEITQSKFTLPPTVDPQMADMSDQTESSVRDLAVPFPDEPIGVGASWTANRALHMRRFSATATTVYRLVRIDGDKGLLDVALTMSSPPQPMDVPGRANASLTLESMTARGSGTTTFDLQSLVRKSDVDMTVRTVMTLGAADQKHAMDMSMKMGIHLEPR